MTRPSRTAQTRRRTTLAATLALAAALTVGPALALDEALPAKDLFGAVPRPTAERRPMAAGTYAKGCLAGGASLSSDGPGWQVMRPSRNRAWGHPALVDFVGRLAAAARDDGWPGLLVGDMAQPRGGPMRTGHASHQLGLDVDLWLTPMPDRRLTAREREDTAAPSMLRTGTLEVDPARFGSLQASVIRRAALFPEVSRIFVHPGIKQALCATPATGADRAWLAKVRAWWGHDTHFHVRLRCPPGEPACVGQEPPPAGDGCGAELAWWFTDEPWKPKDPPLPPPRSVTLAELPAECRGVLAAP
ncbi:MAG TPA: penicillin-insensitive murein endopeptidase [Geminicoccaceae bacterium]